MDERTRLFEAHRRTLEGLAYRMLGTLADARDVVQETYLRWSQVALGEVRDPRAWLVTACARLALNALGSARARRETYVGTWLPEPYVEAVPGPAERAEVDESVSVALLVALEQLTPPERAAFLLHEVFEYGFDEIALMLGKSSAACRKLASRARAAIRAARPRFETSADEHQRLAEAFVRAARSGDVAALRALLAEDVAAYGDGGGKAEAAREVLQGADTVAAFLARVWREIDTSGVPVRIEPRWFNGRPGLLVYEGGVLTTALSVGVAGGRIARIFALRNPDKLAAFGG